MRTPIIASYVLAAALIIFSLIQQNNEFLIYGFILAPLVAVIHWSDKFFSYDSITLWAFAAWMFLHSIGGLASIGNTRIYDFILIPIVGEPYLILKYDQVLHVYTYIVMAGFVGRILSSIIKPKANYWTTFTIIVLAASGIGGINEILEFLPVVLFDAPGPGGYINTALDICANFLGALIGAWAYLKYVKH